MYLSNVVRGTVATSALVTVALLAVEATQSTERIAIVNTTVISMAKGATSLARQSVIVEGARISRIGPADTTPIPAGAIRIDGGGKFVIPGLADMHVHLEYFDTPDILALFVVNGVTTVRNMDGRPLILDWKRQAAENSLTSPRISTAGPLLDGRPPVLPDNTVVVTADEARAAVNAQASAGYDFVKIYSALSPDAFRAIVETAREHRLPVAGHVPRAVGLDTFLTQGAASIEHLSDYASAIESDSSPFKGKPHWIKRFLGMPIDALRLQAVAQKQASVGVWSVPTLIQPLRAMLRADDLKERMASAEVRYMPAGGRNRWHNMASAAAGRMDDDDWKLAAQGAVNRLQVVSTLRSGGVGILAGTDTPNPFVVPGFSLHDELELLVAAGFPPGDALAAATREAARFAAAPDWGVVETGKVADLVVLDANPLDRISHTRRIHGVMLRGRWISAADRSKLLDRLK